MSRKTAEELRPARSSGEFLHLVRGREPSKSDFEALEFELGRLDAHLQDLIQDRLRMKRRKLLCVNLLRTMRLLASSEKLTNVMQGGCTAAEMRILAALHVMSTAAQVAAWSLFDIEERQALIDLVNKLESR